ncbi:MAG: ATP-dependent endonuclease [Clostridia bacterium]
MKGNKTKVLESVSFLKTEENIFQLFDKIGVKNFKNQNDYYTGFKFDLPVSSINTYWNRFENGLMDLSSVFVSFLDTEKRLEAANPPTNISLTQEAAKHPIHFMQRDDSIEMQFSKYFSQAFGEDLIVHRNAGSKVPLYVGKRPIIKDGEDRVSTSYITKLEELDLLHEQGDGMRSFVGVMLYAFISFYSILLIDEPEAFLHPPQAKLLGKMISNDIPKGRQVFISTHSEEFIQGLLDPDNDKIKIIRINRHENINHISVLDSDEISKIWNDSLLRHSNVFSGLFHQKVVICEADSDCRFYNAMMTSYYEETGQQQPSVLFIHCGGKHRIPVVIEALIKLNVDVRVIVDFDILNNQHPIEEIFSLLGGDWNAVSSMFKIVKSQIEHKRPALLTADLNAKITEIFSRTNETNMPTNKINEINGLLKKSSVWGEAKVSGKTYIPSGTASQAFEDMQTVFKQHHLFILEIGELECFIKQVGNHGPKWVSEVLDRYPLSNQIFEPAKAFIKTVLA